VEKIREKDWILRRDYRTKAYNRMQNPNRKLICVLTHPQQQISDARQAANRAVFPGVIGSSTIIARHRYRA